MDAGGYLATITTAGEDAFVHQLLLSTAADPGEVEPWFWLSGTDAATEGTWLLDSGPENGTEFWNSVDLTLTYANWGPSEPNDYNLGEDELSMAWGSGLWNDLPADAERGYVIESDDAPASYAFTDEDTVRTITADTLLQNDSDVDNGAVLSIDNVTSATSTLGAAISVVSGDVHYDPTAAPDIQALAEGEYAVDSFTYTVTDEHGATDTATVSFTVAGVNDAPDATNDEINVAERADSVILPATANGNVLTDVLTGDTDPDLTDVLVVYAVAKGASGVLDAAAQANVGVSTEGQWGNLTLHGDGSYSYEYLNTDNVIAGEAPLVDIFHYQISDGHGGFDDATLTINISGTDLDLTITPTGSPHDADPFQAQRGNDIVHGTDLTDDDIRGHEGDDQLYGGDIGGTGGGNDLLVGGPGNDTLFGGANHDRLIGGLDNDELHGGGGDDVLRGGEGLDEVHGGDGDDTLVAIGSEVVDGETYDGGNDSDTLLVDGSADFTGSTVLSIELLNLVSNTTIDFDTGLNAGGIYYQGGYNLDYVGDGIANVDGSPGNEFGSTGPVVPDITGTLLRDDAAPFSLVTLDVVGDDGAGGSPNGDWVEIMRVDGTVQTYSINYDDGVDVWHTYKYDTDTSTFLLSDEIDTPAAAFARFQDVDQLEITVRDSGDATGGMGIDNVELQSAGSSATFGSNQADLPADAASGLAAALEVRGTVGGTDIVTILVDENADAAGRTVDLSGWTFPDNLWTPEPTDNDRIVIDGSAVTNAANAENLIGSSEWDIITGGAGNDTITYKVGGGSTGRWRRSGRRRQRSSDHRQHHGGRRRRGHRPGVHADGAGDGYGGAETAPTTSW